MISISNPAPVALFTGNRPDHMALAIEALADNPLARASPLYVFSDAVRTASDRPLVERARSLVGQEARRERFAAITFMGAQRTRGRFRLLVEGVSAVIRRHGRIIVLEDSPVGRPDLLTYMNACLDYYAADATIGSITGHAPLTTLPLGIAGDVAVESCHRAHGWATWEDRWRAVDWPEPADDVASAPAGIGPPGLPGWTPAPSVPSIRLGYC